MKRRWNGLKDWLDHRTGVQTAVRNFLYEDIPASSGWHQVFGSVAVVLDNQKAHGHPIRLRFGYPTERSLPINIRIRGHR